MKANHDTIALCLSGIDGMVNIRQALALTASIIRRMSSVGTDGNGRGRRNGNVRKIYGEHANDTRK